MHIPSPALSINHGWTDTENSFIVFAMHVGETVTETIGARGGGSMLEKDNPAICAYAGAFIVCHAVSDK